LRGHIIKEWNDTTREEVRKMASVQDVAKFFIDLAQKQNQQDSGDLMTNLRLQKLLYFAQGWHLARYDRPLFDAPIHAWRLGPVVQEVYQAYNPHRANGISSDARTAADAFTPDEFALLLDVAREYNHFSTSALVDKTHAAASPWAQANLSDLFPLSIIQAYFKGIDPLPSFDDVLASLEVYVPNRDEDGNAVFPKSFDEDWEVASVGATGNVL